MQLMLLGLSSLLFSQDSEIKVSGNLNANGQRDGVWVFKGKDENYVRTETYKNGVLHGLWSVEDEYMKLRVLYIEGLKEGKADSESADGSSFVSYYFQDKKIYGKKFNKEGKLKYETISSISPVEQKTDIWFSEEGKVESIDIINPSTNKVVANKFSDEGRLIKREVYIKGELIKETEY
jgi:antitoxin component YwqK of YwqJK toxin-antitoxin module